MPRVAIRAVFSRYQADATARDHVLSASARATMNGGEVETKGKPIKKGRHDEEAPAFTHLLLMYRNTFESRPIKSFAQAFSRSVVSNSSRSMALSSSNI
jgi:hypothetical protein